MMSKNFVAMLLLFSVVIIFTGSASMAISHATMLTMGDSIKGAISSRLFSVGQAVVMFGVMLGVSTFAILFATNPSKKEKVDSEQN